MVKPTLFAELEALGETEVRRMLAMGKCGAVGSDHRLAVEGWVDGKVRERMEAAADKRHALEEEALLVAREANDIARAAIESQSTSKNIQQEKAEPAPDHWYKKPIGVIGITVAAGLLLLLAATLIKPHLGIP